MADPGLLAQLTARNVNPPPWKTGWRQASYRGVPFYVEQGGKASGRRTVPHEYPKRDTWYAEDLGKRMFEFTVMGYVIGPFYREVRDALEAALEDAADDGPGVLTLPTRPDQTVTCVRYTSTERRQFGGFCMFEMLFIDAGSVPAIATGPSHTAVLSKAQAAAAAGAASFQQYLATNFGIAAQVQ
jgi:prophage DNA circulation protein